MFSPPLLIFSGLGWPEIVLILIVVLLLFGAKRVPEIMRSMGRGVREFKKGIKEASRELEEGEEEEGEKKDSTRLPEETKRVEGGKPPHGEGA